MSNKKTYEGDVGENAQVDRAFSTASVHGPVAATAAAPACAAPVVRAADPKEDWKSKLFRLQTDWIYFQPKTDSEKIAYTILTSQLRETVHHVTSLPRDKIADWPFQQCVATVRCAHCSRANAYVVELLDVMDRIENTVFRPPSVTSTKLLAESVSSRTASIPTVSAPALSASSTFRPSNT